MFSKFLVHKPEKFLSLQKEDSFLTLSSPLCNNTLSYIYTCVNLIHKHSRHCFFHCMFSGRHSRTGSISSELYSSSYSSNTADKEKENTCIVKTLLGNLYVIKIGHISLFSHHPNMSSFICLEILYQQNCAVSLKNMLLSVSVVYDIVVGADKWVM